MRRAVGGRWARWWGGGVPGLVLVAANASAQVPSPQGVLSTPQAQADAAAPKAVPGRTKLDYMVAPGTVGCDDEALFRKWVASDLGGTDPFELDGPAQFTLRVRIAQQGVPIRGVFELFDAKGNKLLTRETLRRRCDLALDWMSLDVAVTVFLPERTCENECTMSLKIRVSGLEEALLRDRDKTEELRDDVEALTVRLEREREEHEAALRALRREMDRRRFVPMDLTYALSAGALITANLTPNVGPGVWLGGELRAGPLAMGLELRAVLPSRVEVGPYDTDLSTYAALFVPCGRYSYFFGCVVVGAGVTYDYDSNSPGGPGGNASELLQLGGRLGAEVPFAENRLAVRAWGEVLYSTPPIDIRYVRDGVPLHAWNRPDVSAFFGVGFVVKFGDEQAR